MYKIKEIRFFIGDKCTREVGTVERDNIEVIRLVNMLLL